MLHNWWYLPFCCGACGAKDREGKAKQMKHIRVIVINMQLITNANHFVVVDVLQHLFIILDAHVLQF